MWVWDVFTYFSLTGAKEEEVGGGSVIMVWKSETPRKRENADFNKWWG